MLSRGLRVSNEVCSFSFLVSFELSARMQSRVIPLHLFCEEDVVLFVESKPTHEQLCERTLAEVRVIACYLQIAGVVTMSKEDCGDDE